MLFFKISAESTSKCNTRQNYNKSLKNSSLGVEKFNFSLGLSVYLQLDGMDELVAEFPEVRPLRDVLPYQLVHVLYRAFLPRGVAVREVHRGLQGLRYFPVGTELKPVVRGYRQHVLPVRIEQPDDGIRDLLVIHTVR